MAKRSLSPFTERGMITDPDNFFGREAEIEAIFAALLSGKSAVIHGDPKIGKSSLLQHVLYLSKEKGLSAQYVDLAGVTEVVEIEEALSAVNANILLIDHVEELDLIPLALVNSNLLVLATRNSAINLPNSDHIALESFTPEQARAYVLQPALPPLDQQAFDHLPGWVDHDYHPLKVTIAADLLWNNSPRPAYQTVHMAYAQSLNYNFQDNKPKLNTTPKPPKRSLIKRILGIG